MEIKIPEYIDKWLKVIDGMQNENTYKLAWGRAIIECIYRGLYSEVDDKAYVSLYDISRCMLKYYWNQIFFFNLRQNPINIKGKTPLIVQETNKLIEIYKKETNSNIPVWFDKVEESLDYRDLDKTINNIAKVLPNDVSWRFKLVNKEEIDLYEYDNKARSKHICLSQIEASLLKEYAIIISRLLNYKWAQLLEKFNYAPKIVNKVNSISKTKLDRESLTKYKKELLKEFKDGKVLDFYTGEPLKDNDISVDHVIPWSFMYSDDIWNLVLTSRSNNSSKSNSIPTEEIIMRLKERNIKINGLLEDKYNLELENAINNNYVDKYYYECRL